MSIETQRMSIEDIALTEVFTIKSLLKADVDANDNASAAVWAAYELARQLENYLIQLDSFINEKIGILEITLPKHGLFHFDVPDNQEKFLDVKIKPMN